MENRSNVEIAIIFGILPCVSILQFFNERWIIGLFLSCISLAVLRKHPPNKLKFTPIMRWGFFIIIGGLLAFFSIEVPDMRREFVFTLMGAGLIILWPIAKELDMKSS